jgi:hypothetical protein
MHRSKKSNTARKVSTREEVCEERRVKGDRKKDVQVMCGLCWGEWGVGRGMDDGGWEPQRRTEGPFGIRKWLAQLLLTPCTYAVTCSNL